MKRKILQHIYIYIYSIWKVQEIYFPKCVSIDHWIKYPLRRTSEHNHKCFGFYKSIWFQIDRKFISQSVEKSKFEASITVASIDGGHKSNQTSWILKLAAAGNYFRIGRVDPEIKPRQEIISESWWIKSNFECNYTFPMDLFLNVAPNSISFGAKSIGTV